ncbi:HAD family hydrolase [Denitrobaculum tricleocarpae]|uniref:HAD family hydrolase n=1 Tax=Denitrobaculum tricleocarpae TaxID=2591009 RepID=A0A545TXX8_9PROT|nr:HAD family hydrolase [Denitrobaculum tricleocarpae]TQV82078.1 HAD family hydrolase [Denitrobaculum tricleocarpae]
MILIFDLDDTLYDERSFVLSGLLCVAQHGSQEFGLDPEASFSFMKQVLEHEGRGSIFDRWLAQHGIANRKRVAACVKIYRHHHPNITLPSAHREMLHRLQLLYPLYLVTDGHKVAQQRKVEALGVGTFFRRVFITHRFGIAHAKPSLYCFERIKQAEGVDWPQLLYVGDNPSKDFVNLNKVGAVTVRIHTGIHAQAVVETEFDATHHIDRLSDFETLLAHITD